MHIGHLTGHLILSCIALLVGACNYRKHMQITEHWEHLTQRPIPQSTLDAILIAAAVNAQTFAPASTRENPLEDLKPSRGEKDNDRIGLHSAWQRSRRRSADHPLIDDDHREDASMFGEAGQLQLREMSIRLENAPFPRTRGENQSEWSSSSENFSENNRIMAKVSLSEAPSYQLPKQKNRLALVLDPMSKQVPFTFGVEMFPAGHRTTPHVHTVAHEMFFIVSGGGEAFCNGKRFRVGPGDTVVFPPGCEHGIDADESADTLYCLELMLPNQMFAEYVRAGELMDGLLGDDMCVLAAIGCS
jgi:mannose-6-phosphate isomerase-like protein (cupin superfamily)